MWEEEEEKRKTRFDAEYPGIGRRAGLESVPQIDGEVVAASHSNSELYCAETAGETAAGCTGPTEGGETGWVLVCGQGFQLLQVRTTDE